MVRKAIRFWRVLGLGLLSAALLSGVTEGMAWAGGETIQRRVKFTGEVKTNGHGTMDDYKVTVFDVKPSTDRDIAELSILTPVTKTDLGGGKFRYEFEGDVKLSNSTKRVISNFQFSIRAEAEVQEVKWSGEVKDQITDDDLRKKDNPPSTLSHKVPDVNVTTQQPKPASPRQPTATPRQAASRPTRTPAALPGFQAECKLYGDAVTLELRVLNGSAVDLTGVTASHPNVTTTGSAELDLVTEPATRRELIRNNSVRFKWQGRKSGEGQICVSAEATAQTPDGTTVTTGRTDCGCIGTSVEPTRTPLPLRPTRTPRATATRTPTPTPTPARFNAQGLEGECEAIAVDGKVLVTFYLEITNRTGAALKDVTPFLADIRTTGNVNLLITSGPQPDFLRELRKRGRARFKWQGQAPADSRGTVLIRVGATATGPNGESVTTGWVESNTLDIPPRHIYKGAAVSGQGCCQAADGTRKPSPMQCLRTTAVDCKRRAGIFWPDDASGPVRVCDARGKICVPAGARCGNGIVDPGEQCEFDEQCAPQYYCANCQCEKEEPPRKVTPIRVAVGCCQLKWGKILEGQVIGPGCHEEFFKDSCNTIRGRFLLTGVCGPAGSCTLCGNSVTDPGEECDDANANNSDACKNDCTLNGCGDGVVRSDAVTIGGITLPAEECDDANLVDDDGCDSNCTLTGCGNGIVTAGEECDDGNGVDGDGCDSNCTLTPGFQLPRCPIHFDPVLEPVEGSLAAAQDVPPLIIGSDALPPDLLTLRNILRAKGADLKTHVSFSFAYTSPVTTSGFAYDPEPDQPSVLLKAQPIIAYFSTSPAGPFAFSLWPRQNPPSVSSLVVSNGVVQREEVQIGNMAVVSIDDHKCHLIPASPDLCDICLQVISRLPLGLGSIPSFIICSGATIAESGPVGPLLCTALVGAVEEAGHVLTNNCLCGCLGMCESEYEGTFDGNVEDKGGSGCPGSATLTGEAKVTARACAGTFPICGTHSEYRGSVDLLQKPGICDDYSGNRGFSGIFFSSGSTSFQAGPLNARGTFRGSAFTGTWTFTAGSGPDVGNGKFKLGLTSGPPAP